MSQQEADHTALHDSASQSFQEEVLLERSPGLEIPGPYQHNDDFLPFYLSHKEPYRPTSELQGAPCRSAQGMWLSTCPQGRCARMPVLISPFLVKDSCFYEVRMVLTTHNCKIQEKIKMRRSVNYNRILTAMDKTSRNLKRTAVCLGEVTSWQIMLNERRP